MAIPIATAVLVEGDDARYRARRNKTPCARSTHPTQHTRPRRETELGQSLGVLIAIVSSSLGGTAAAVTRYLVGNADPLTLAILRWGIGFVCVLPIALLLRVRWPRRSDWLAVAALGICFFGLFFILYNIAVGYTTAARASLALATLPLQTMVVGALLGIEPLTARKSAGVAIAVLGVFARARVGPVRRSARGVARGIDHDRRGPLHGLLQRLVSPLHRTIERARIPGGRHGLRRGGPRAGRAADRPDRRAGELRRAAMDRRRLSRRRRRRARVHSLGHGAAAGDADARGQHHDGQSHRGGAAGRLARRRADHAQPDRRAGRGFRGHLGRNDGKSQSRAK